MCDVRFKTNVYNYAYKFDIQIKTEKAVHLIEQADTIISKVSKKISKCVTYTSNVKINLKIDKINSKISIKCMIDQSIK